MNQAILNELSALRDRIDTIEKQVKADTPPPLPPQWRHESEPPVMRQVREGDWYYSPPLGAPRQATFTHRADEVQYCLVPAQPRPANYTDSDGQEWEAGEWASPEQCVEAQWWFVNAEVDGVVFSGSPFRGHRNGWRWTAVPVKKQPEVRRVVDSVYDRTGAHVEQVPLYETAPHSRRFRLDREAIAREEVIREFRDILERTANGPNRAVEYLAERLSELRGER